MPTEWYIQKGDRKTGPITSKQLKYMASTGNIQPDDLVWKEGMEKPAPASAVPGLFPADSDTSVPEQSPPQVKHEEAEGVSDGSSGTEWHYALDNEQIGPVSESKLKSLVKSSIVLPTSLVWNETLPDWVPAESIKGLFPSPEITAEQKLPQDSSLAPKENESTSSPQKASLKDSLLASAKTTAQITAKKTERLKLTSTTLPLLYLKLGKHDLSSAVFRAEFPEQFQELDTIQNQLTELVTQPKSDAKTFGDKAKAVAGQAVRTAKAAQLSLQQKKALSRLGRAIYERHHEKSGPEDVVAPIRNALSRVAALDEEMAQLSQSGSSVIDGNPGKASAKSQVTLGTLGCFAVVLIMCCGVLSPVIKEAEKRAAESDRPDAYCPHDPGTSREYLHVLYPPGGPVPIVTLNHVLHKDNGEIKSTIAKTGRFKNATQDLTLDNIEWLVDGSTSSTSYHRVKDGFIEHGSSLPSGQVDWKPILKIGVKPDDTWEWNPLPDMKTTFTVTKQTTWNEKPALIVREETALPKNGAIVVFHTYAMGIGKVKSSGSMIQPGETPPIQKTYDETMVGSGEISVAGSKPSTKRERNQNNSATGLLAPDGKTAATNTQNSKSDSVSGFVERISAFCNSEVRETRPDNGYEKAFAVKGKYTTLKGIHSAIGEPSRIENEEDWSSQQWMYNFKDGTAVITVTNKNALHNANKRDQVIIHSGRVNIKLHNR